MASVAHLIEGESMRGATQESTSRYLAMALATRRLMKHLDSFVATGEMSESIRKALKNLLTIMDAGWQTGNAFAPVPGESPFGRYEQAQIVSQVAETFSSRDLRGKVGLIVHETMPSGDRAGAVRDINAFLYDLENKALHKYSESSNQREW